MRVDALSAFYTASFPLTLLVCESGRFDFFVASHPPVVNHRQWISEGNPVVHFLSKNILYPPSSLLVCFDSFPRLPPRLSFSSFSFLFDNLPSSLSPGGFRPALRHSPVSLTFRTSSLRLSFLILVYCIFPTRSSSMSRS